MPKVVLVTGGTGFVGSHLLQLLSVSEPDVSLVAWRRPATPGRPTAVRPRRNYGNESRISWREVDLLSTADVRRAVDKDRPNVIYHCAAVAGVQNSWRNTLPALEGNVRGTDHLLRALQNSGVGTRILIPGSALVYRPSGSATAEDDELGPVSPYGLSKLAQEMLGQRYAEEGLHVILTRSFTHIGPGQDVSYAASSFACQVARIEAQQSAPVIKVGFLGAKRDLTDVRDTVRAYLELMNRGTAGQPYNVCSGHAHEMAAVLDGLIRQARVPVQVEVDESRLRPSDNPLLLGDPTRLRSEVGWTPSISLRETLGDLLDYWRTQLSQP